LPRLEPGLLTGILPEGTEQQNKNSWAHFCKKTVFAGRLLYVVTTFASATVSFLVSSSPGSLMLGPGTMYPLYSDLGHLPNGRLTDDVFPLTLKHKNVFGKTKLRHFSGKRPDTLYVPFSQRTWLELPSSGCNITRLTYVRKSQAISHSCKCSLHKTSANFASFFFKVLIPGLHVQKKQLFCSQSERFESFLNRSAWLKKSKPALPKTPLFGHVSRE